jgi:2-polyprenyl-3-methyl-5-hydroxy-6-metoxy-1,4-benzoquinol methylase
MTAPRPTQTARSRVVRTIRKLVEFKGIHRAQEGQYRSRIKALYDGPQGAAIRFSSVLSLHDPMVGRLLRSGQFDSTRFTQILDVGSGSGQILRHLITHAKPETRIIACDLSYQMLKRAQQRFQSDKVSYVAADIQHLPFADESFDCITCGWVIEHLADPLPGLREMARVLQPGGSLLLMATEDTITGAFSSRTWKCRTYNRLELQHACEAVGLTWHKPLWFTPIHRALRLGGILVEAQKPLK